VRSAELVGVAQPVARCGEVGGIGRRRQVAQRRMRALAVVVVGPSRNFGPGVIEAVEQSFVEKLVAHPAVEAFTEAGLHRLSRCDEVPGDLVVFKPGQHGVAGELGVVVRDDHARLAAAGDQRRQFARHPPSRDRGVGDHCQAFPGHVIDDVQDPEATTIRELVMDKIQRPAGIRPSPHRMNALLGNWPVTSHGLNVSRHSLACGDSPFLQARCSRVPEVGKSRWAVPRATVTAAISLLGLVPGRLGYFAREAGDVPSPIAETGAEAVHGARWLMSGRLPRVTQAPALRRDRSFNDRAGRGGFEQHAIVATLVSLRRGLILDHLLRRLCRLRGRCANDCRGACNCTNRSGRGGQNPSTRNSVFVCHDEPSRFHE
jgi:hypothetical protein